MTTRLTLSLLAAVTTACGGGASAPDTVPASGDAHADHDHGAAGDTEPGAETPPVSDPDQAKADLVAAETAAFDKAKPVFEKHCAKCHTKDGKNAKPKSLEHFEMTSYPFGGHHAAEIGPEVKKALGIGGGKATMPLDHPGAVTGDELALISAWADAWQKSHEGGAHPEHEHGADHHDGDHHH